MNRGYFQHGQQDWRKIHHQKTDRDAASEDGVQGRKGVSKFASFVDSGISYTVMKLMGNRHISNSYQIALASLENDGELVVTTEDTGNTR